MRVINFIKSIFGYIWVILAITISIMGFKNMGSHEKFIAAKSGLHLSENWQGGAVNTIIEHQNYQTIIHKPVFAGFISESVKGFIQIDWRTTGDLPRFIEEKFDYDKDQQADFAIRLDTVNNKATLQSFSRQVISIKDQDVLDFGNSKSVKINLLKKNN